MPTVAFHTLGCKVNQYETEKIANELRRFGFDAVNFTDAADVYVINSCTVTQVADTKSRQAVRAAKKRNPLAKVVLTGCYAETSTQSASEIEGVSLVVGNAGKSDLAVKIADLFGIPVSAHSATTPLAKTTRTRAVIKVQDGCDQFCAYCAVPLARSVMSSTPYSAVLEEASELARNGYKEVVLAGIRLGRYEDSGRTLTHLIDAITAIDGIERVRLSSIELTDIPEGMIELMSKNRKICRHLHIPLQSGDDGILKRMNRPYTSGEFVEGIKQIREQIQGIAITTDIIVGFPGETAEGFENTYRVAETVRFSRSHVFRFSPRSGTAASEFKDDVKPSEKEDRSARLITLGNSSAGDFARSLVGQTVPILVEGKVNRDGFRSGLTDTYIRVFVKADKNTAGRLVDVRIESECGGVCTGVLDPVISI